MVNRFSRAEDKVQKAIDLFDAKLNDATNSLVKALEESMKENNVFYIHFLFKYYNIVGVTYDIPTNVDNTLQSEVCAVVDSPISGKREHISLSSIDCATTYALVNCAREALANRIS